MKQAYGWFTMDAFKLFTDGFFASKENGDQFVIYLTKICIKRPFILLIVEILHSNLKMR